MLGGRLSAEWHHQLKELLLLERLQSQVSHFQSYLHPLTSQHLPSSSNTPRWVAWCFKKSPLASVRRWHSAPIRVYTKQTAERTRLPPRLPSPQAALWHESPNAHHKMTFCPWQRPSAPADMTGILLSSNVHLCVCVYERARVSPGILWLWELRFDNGSDRVKSVE